MSQKTYYFDYNSTTPTRPTVYEAMKPYFEENFANPSSLHHMGRAPYRAIREARRQVAELMGAEAEDEIIFTSGGTESNNLAIRSALKYQPFRREVVTTSVEHSSVHKLFQTLEDEGYLVHWLKVDQTGQIAPGELEKCLNQNTAVVSIMAANNETGVLFPFEELAQEIKACGALFHVDGVQAVGKTKVSMSESLVDLFSLSAHKIYGPKGIGALYCRKSLKIKPLTIGGNQERGRRAGTENVPAIVGFGHAADEIHQKIEQESFRQDQLRQLLEKKVREEISDISINGIESPRLANTSNILFRGVESEALLMALDQRGICVSRGSACMSGAEEASHVLKAMGLTEEEANASMRFSLGEKTTEEDIHFLILSLKEIVERQRCLNPNDLTLDKLAG